jgi:hypothetical protein
VSAPRRAAQLVATFEQLADVVGRPVETVTVDPVARLLSVVVTGDDFDEVPPLHAPLYAGQIAFTGIESVELNDPSAGIVDFLLHLDPHEIEQAALNRQGFGSGSLAAAIITVLAELAHGRPATP